MTLGNFRRMRRLTIRLLLAAAALLGCGAADPPATSAKVRTIARLGVIAVDGLVESASRCRFLYSSFAAV